MLFVGANLVQFIKLLYNTENVFGVTAAKMTIYLVNMIVISYFKEITGTCKGITLSFSN